MNKAKMMLNSVLHEKNKINKSILIKYYIEEYKKLNPTFVPQIFEVFLEHIAHTKDLETLELITSNFAQELAMYGVESIRWLEVIVEYLIDKGYINLLVKISPILENFGNKHIFRLLKKLVKNPNITSYVKPDDVYVLKKAMFNIKDNISAKKNSKEKLDIILPDDIFKWRKITL